MKLAMMQPTFLPWQGFFALAASADTFLLLDDFQFSRQSWQQRNRLFTGREAVGWFTVPVDRHAGAGTGAGAGAWPTLREARPMLDPFRKKFLATLRQSYARAPHTADVLGRVEAWIGREYESLAALNIAFIEDVLALLEIRTRVLLASQVGHAGTRSAVVDDLLRRTGATTYLAARGSFGYMREDGVFPRAGLELRFQHFAPQPYAQVQSQAFVPYLAVLDALLQVGPAATRALIEQGQRPFQSWEELEQTLAPGADELPESA
ncbi:MAG: WbqC family protein [Planctomycetota bacterium]